MKLSSRYTYVAGVSTGMIMALLSVMTTFLLQGYLESGGSLALVIVLDIIVGLLSGIILSWLINKAL